jgi:hypothetical protein
MANKLSKKMTEYRADFTVAARLFEMGKVDAAYGSWKALKGE